MQKAFVLKIKWWHNCQIIVSHIFVSNKTISKGSDVQSRLLPTPVVSALNIPLSLSRRPGLPWRDCNQCPGTQLTACLCSGVWWPSGLFFASSGQASVPGSSAVHFIPCVTHYSRSVTEHSVGRILWHGQQPTIFTQWRSLTARSSNKTPRPPRRGQFIQWKWIYSEI